MSRVRGHVLGARHVHASAVHVARHSGVRLRAQLSPGDRHHLLDRLEDRLRPDGTVQTDDVRAQAVERARNLFGPGAVRGQQVASDRHLRNHGCGRIDVARSPDGLGDLVQVAERFQDEAVGAPFLESLELLA